MHFAGAEHGVTLTAFARGAAHMAWLAQIDGDRAGDAADDFTPSNDAGNCLFVHAVL